VGSFVSANKYFKNSYIIQRNDRNYFIFVSAVFILVAQKAIWEQKLKYILRKLTPINIFNIPGVSCCINMQNNINNNIFIKHFFCYDSRNIYDANMLIIWGYISPKLARLLPEYYNFMPQKRFILHINSCDHITNASFNFNTQLECGVFDQANIRRIIKEARQCLQA
jgi:hypothetical protein